VGQDAVLGHVAMNRNRTVSPTNAPATIRALNRSGAPEPQTVAGGAGADGQPWRSLAGNAAVLPVDDVPVFHTMRRLLGATPVASSVLVGGVGVLQVLGPVVLTIARNVPPVTPPPVQPVMDPLMEMV
jgi:hypothetical protein